jgi:mannose-1-phosphate guanylyltransferase/mannose-6-phosphate isomerase
VLPSDHVITLEKAFHDAVALAVPAADRGDLVTFGIVPTAPETGYGYIKAARGEGVRAVDRFVEKPDLETAKDYVESGGYFWNSGMFLFKASRYLSELRRLDPGMLAACEQALALAKRDSDFIRLDVDAFISIRGDSIDYAVMEKTSAAAVVPLEAGWSDVGSWSALWDVSAQDSHGNAHHGDVIEIDCKNTYAYGSRLIALIGLQNVVVVETDDAVLVGNRDRIQEVKEVVGRIKMAGRSEAVAHRKVYRPWGAYDSIDNGARFQVKRITVKPGATLSLQMHHHRAEHWIVVSGTAEVTRGDEVILLTENQSTYIPLGVTHRLKNPGKLPLELIEVQSGSYLGEDDIVRFEDAYGRTHG